MRLPRSFRTSSFRLTVVYAAIFTLSGLMLFAVIAWSVNRFMSDQIDAIVSNELAEIQADAGSTDIQALRHVIDGVTRHSPGFYYLLQAPDGRVLAGNMMAIRPQPGPRHLEWPHQTPERHAGSGIRGRGVVLPNGSYLFVGVSDYQLAEVREVVIRTFVLGVGATIVLAMAGGIIMSLGVLRRVESVSKASRAIMEGDLAQRMVLSGANDEFDHLGSSLNAMLDRIQDLMQGLQQVSNDIAHDLRTPLARLRQRLELAQRREHTADGFKVAIDDAIAHVDSILGMFGALLRIAQIEAGTRRAAFRPVGLDGVLNDLVEAYQPVAEEKGQALDGTIASDLCLVGDRELLILMFANLIENAIRHSPTHSRISIEAYTGSNVLRVIVADSGPGIPAAFRQKVLQRFYRLETSRTTPGSGLGLSLVNAIVSLHDGTLTLEDNEPGLKCRLDFPVRRESQRPSMEYSAP
ncbi:MAG TPA: ATP-binding protein [Rhodopila sp.]|nr:ATP-binding protein [Rhodopila sp.]